MQTFVFKGRLHAIHQGEIYLYLGESVVDQVAAMDGRLKIEVTGSAWGRIKAMKYIEAMEDSIQKAIRQSHGASTDSSRLGAVRLSRGPRSA